MPFALYQIPGVEVGPRQKLSDALRQIKQDQQRDRAFELEEQRAQLEIQRGIARMQQQEADARGAGFMFGKMADSLAERTELPGRAAGVGVYDDHVSRAQELNAADMASMQRLAASGMSPQGIAKMQRDFAAMGQRRLFEASRASLEEQLSDGMMLGKDSPFAVNGQISPLIEDRLRRLSEVLAAVDSPAQLLQVERQIQGTLEAVAEQQQRVELVQSGLSVVEEAKAAVAPTDPRRDDKLASLSALGQRWGMRGGPRTMPDLQREVESVLYPETRMVQASQLSAIVNAAKWLSESGTVADPETAFRQAYQMVTGGVPPEQGGAIQGDSAGTEPEADEAGFLSRLLGFTFQQDEAGVAETASKLGDTFRRKKAETKAQAERRRANEEATLEEFSQPAGARIDPQEEMRQLLQQLNAGG